MNTDIVVLVILTKLLLISQFVEITQQNDEQVSTLLPQLGHPGRCLQPPWDPVVRHGPLQMVEVFRNVACASFFSKK